MQSSFFCFLFAGIRLSRIYVYLLSSVRLFLSFPPATSLLRIPFPQLLFDKVSLLLARWEGGTEKGFPPYPGGGGSFCLRSSPPRPRAKEALKSFPARGWGGWGGRLLRRRKGRSGISRYTEERSYGKRGVQSPFWSGNPMLAW